jgi:hypothetical protein
MLWMLSCTAGPELGCGVNVRLQFSSKMPKAKRVVVAAPAEPSSALSRAHTVMPASSYHNGSLAFVPPSPEAGAGVRASPGAGGSPAAMPDLKEFVGQLPKALAVHTSKVRCGGWVGAPRLGHRVPVWHQSLGLRSFGAHTGMCRVGGPLGCCRPLGCPVLGLRLGVPRPPPDSHRVGGPPYHPHAAHPWRAPRCLPACFTARLRTFIAATTPWSHACHCCAAHCLGFWGQRSGAFAEVATWVQESVLPAFQMRVWWLGVWC